MLTRVRLVSSRYATAFDLHPPYRSAVPVACPFHHRAMSVNQRQAEGVGFEPTCRAKRLRISSAARRSVSGYLP